MEDKGKGPLPHLFCQDGSHVVIGIARMNDQRQAGRPRRRDVIAKAFCLHLARRAVIEIVEARLADGHDLWMGREPYEILARHVRFFRSVVRMRADGAVDLVIGFGDVENCRKLCYARRNGHHAADPRRHSARDHRVALFGEIGKVQMAMAVDEHLRAYAGSTGST